MRFLQRLQWCTGQLLSQRAAMSTNTTTTPLHVVSNCYKSGPLSKQAGCNVWMKMDNEQIPGSFKIRGIGHLAQHAKNEGKSQLISSSGGNAGLAAAYAGGTATRLFGTDDLIGQQLGLTVKVIVPSTTPELVRDRLAGYGAQVEVQGSVWDDADIYAKKLLAEADGKALYIPPFDHPLIWEGHASMVEEMVEQLPVKPDVMIVAVGGGGLLCGLMEGLKRVDWLDVRVLAMETDGAGALNASVKSGTLATLPGITSIAKTLGARTVAKRAFEWTQEADVASAVVDDAQALSACKAFLDDHRVLVEPSCGASLAAVYEPEVMKAAFKDKPIQSTDNVVVVVCGGAGITLNMLSELDEVVKAKSS